MKNSTRMDIDEQLEDCGYIDSYTRKKQARSHGRGKTSTAVFQPGTRSLTPEEDEANFKLAIKNYDNSFMDNQTVEQKRRDLDCHPFISSDTLKKLTDDEIIATHKHLYTCQEAAYLSVGMSMFDDGQDDFDDFEEGY